MLHAPVGSPRALPDAGIRRARCADLPAVLDIYNAAIPGREATADLAPLGIEDRRSWFETHGEQRPLWIAEDRVAHAVAHGPELEIEVLAAFVFGHNARSLQLLRRFGFGRSGVLTEVAELDGVLRDLVILTKHLRGDR